MYSEDLRVKHFLPNSQIFRTVAVSILTIIVVVTFPLLSVALSSNIAKAASLPVQMAYVTNGQDGTITPINLSTNPPTALSPISVGSGPDAIAVSPDDTRAYVVNNPVGTVTPIDLTTNPPTALTAFNVGTTPVAIAISPDNTRAYVVNQNPNGSSFPGTVTPINLTTNPPTELTPITVGLLPDAIAITPDGTTAYVVNYHSNDIQPITLATGKVGNPIVVNTGTSLKSISISPDGMHAFLSDGLGGDVVVISIPANATTNHIQNVGTNITDAVVSPNGTTAFASDLNNDLVTEFNPITGTVGSQTPVGYQPGQMAYSQDGSLLGVINSAGDASCTPLFTNISSVTFINVSTGVADSPVCVGNGASAIAISTVPVVSSLSPDSGTVGGGATVEINGSGFTPSSSVMFGSVPATSVTYLSSTSLQVIVPASLPSNTTASVHVTVTSTAGTSVTNSSDNFTYGRPSAYVVNQTDSTVTPIFTEPTPGIAQTPIAVGSGPVNVAMSPDGSEAYVVSSVSGTVTPIDTSTDVAGPAIDVSTGIDSAVVSPDGTMAYVCDATGNNIYPIKLNTNPPLVLPPISVGNDPSSIVLSTDGDYAYVANNNDGTVSILYLANGRPAVVSTVSAGVNPTAMAVSPDGSTLFVVDSNGGVSAGAVTPIYLDSLTAGTQIGVGKGADAIAVSPDGSTIYVAERLENQIVPIDGSTFALGTPITTGSAPSAIAISADGTLAEVTNASDNTVTPITLPSGVAGTTIAVGHHPISISTTPGPMISEMMPSLGSTVGGTQIALRGSGFTPSTQVFFGAVEATGVNVVSESQLTLNSPPGTGSVDVTVVTAQGTSAVVAPQNVFTYIAPSQSPLTLVANNQSANVTPINTLTNVSGSAIGTGNGPQGVAIAPDRSMAYVSNSGDGTITPISLATTPPTPEPAVNTCTGGGNGCGTGSLAITPDGSMLLVADSNDSEIIPYTLPSLTAQTPIPVGAGPAAIAITSDGNTAYVVNESDGTMTVLNLISGTWQAGSTTSIASAPSDIALSPDDTRAYVTDAMSSDVVIIDLTQSPPSVMPTTIPITNPKDIAVTPDGRKAYVTHAGNMVAAINLANDTVTSDFVVTNDLTGFPNAIAIDPSGGYAYAVIYGSNEVTPISTATDTPGTPIGVGTTPVGIAISIPEEPPLPPRNVVAQPENGGVVLSWFAPSSDGGSAVTSYTVTTFGPNAPAPITVPGSQKALTISGLTNYAGYRFEITATNSSGTSGPAYSEVMYPQITLGEFVPVQPDRILDTRFGTGTGGVIAPIGSGQTITLQVAGHGGVPPTGATAVVMNVTATNPTGSGGYLTVYPDDATMPTASNLNFAPGTTIPNLITVKLGADGGVKIYNFSGTTDVIADVAGWYSDGTTVAESRFNPVPPSRILDTRFGTGTGGVIAPIGSGQTITLQVAGQGGVPLTGATAVVMNVTATNPTGSGGYLTVYPTGSQIPTASNLNFSTGETIPNLVIVKLRVGGAVNIYNFSGSTDVIADVAGWYALPGGLSGSRFNPIAPSRILDTRFGTGTGGTIAPIGQGQTLTLQVTGNPGIPSTGVSSVVMNVTATNPTGAGGYLTIYPGGTTKPTASNLNFSAGETIPNLVIVKLGSSGQLEIYNFSGSTDAIADVAGWFNDGTT